MVTLTKDYSDAFGFKLVGHFRSFMGQFTEQGRQIQKICDDDFKATCIKVYPIILSTGVDPKKYVPSTLTATSVRDVLRDMFPTPQLVENDESTGSCSEDDESECVIVGTTIAPNKPKLSPVAVQRIESALKCTKCLTLANDLATIRKNMGETIKNLELENQKFKSENQQLKDQVTKLRKELETEKVVANNRLIKWNKLVSDPEYLAWQDYRNFDSFKRKRTQ